MGFRKSEKPEQREEKGQHSTGTQNYRKEVPGEEESSGLS
jgi:hypothetical protein